MKRNEAEIRDKLWCTLMNNIWYIRYAIMKTYWTLPMILQGNTKFRNTAYDQLTLNHKSIFPQGAPNVDLISFHGPTQLHPWPPTLTHLPVLLFSPESKVMTSPGWRQGAQLLSGLQTGWNITMAFRWMMYRRFKRFKRLNQVFCLHRT